MKYVVELSGVLALATLVSASATAQPTPAGATPQLYSESITLTNFDPGTYTYTGQVHITAHPCPGSDYDVTLLAAGVKNSDQAKDKVSDQVGRIAADVNASAAHCKR